MIGFMTSFGEDAKKKFVLYLASVCNSYCIDATNTIWERVCEMKKQDEVEGKGYGFVIVNEVKSYVRSLYPCLVKSNRRATVTDGRVDGANIG